MSILADTYCTLNTGLAVTAKVADQWLSAIRRAAQTKSTRIVLPSRDLMGKLIDVEPALRPFPKSLQLIVDRGLKDSLQARYRRIAVGVACAPPEVTHRLSELAAEVASFRVLLTPHDSFDVTGRGVLTTVALINGLHLLAEWKRNPRDPAELKKATRGVWWPLHLSDSDLTEHRPGDIWLADLAARTMREAAAVATQNFQHKTLTPIFGGLVLEFVTRSTLHKLLETESLGKTFIPHAKYDHWPGFEVIASMTEAGSLRQVLAAELVRQVAENPLGSSGIAFLRLLGRLPKLPDNHTWGARLFFAQILWELLECDSDVLKKLLSSGQVATALFDCMQFLRNWRVDTPEPHHETIRNRLRDVIACLESYDQFRKLQGLLDVGHSVPTAQTEINERGLV